MNRVLALCLLLVPALTYASEEPAPPAPTKPPVTAQTDDGDKLICRTEKKIGSNRRERVCRTKSELQREREHAEAQMPRLQDGG
jgi:hypothetical protein